MIENPVYIDFIEQFKKSIKDGTFAKLTLAKTMGDTDLRNIYLRLHIIEPAQYNVELTYKYKTEEVTNQYPLEEIATVIAAYIKNPFTTILLFTTAKDLTFKVNKKNATRLIEQDPTFKNPSPVLEEIISRGILK